PVKGAKELFFDPTDGAVVSASQPNRFAPPAASAPGHSGKSVARKKTTTPAPHLPKAPDPDSASQLATLRPLTRTASREPSSTLGLSYWIELVGADGQGRQVTDSRIFRSGERIRLHFRSNAEGYIALILLGSSGTSRALFPDPVRGLTDSRIFPSE